MLSIIGNGLFILFKRKRFKKKFKKKKKKKKNTAIVNSLFYSIQSMCHFMTFQFYKFLK